MELEGYRRDGPYICNKEVASRLVKIICQGTDQLAKMSYHGKSNYVSSFKAYTRVHYKHTRWHISCACVWHVPTLISNQ